MNTVIQKLISDAVSSVLQANGGNIDMPPIDIERTRDPQHGHFACNIAMRLAKPMKQSPRDIAS
ncbi:MAG: arginine--tRNA ligase, partial [Pseudomonadales bacterium]